MLRFVQSYHSAAGVMVFKVDFFFKCLRFFLFSCWLSVNWLTVNEKKYLKGYQPKKLSKSSKFDVGIQGEVKNEKGEIIQKYSLQLDSKPKQDMASSFFVLATTGHHTVTIEAPGMSRNKVAVFQINGLNT